MILMIPSHGRFNKPSSRIKPMSDVESNRTMVGPSRGLNSHRKMWSYKDLPSGKRLHNCGKSPFLMRKSTINGNVQ